jgi:hypothetical protein
MSGESPQREQATFDAALMKMSRIQAHFDPCTRHWGPADALDFAQEIGLPLGFFWAN